MKEDSEIKLKIARRTGVQGTSGILSPVSSASESIAKAESPAAFAGLSSIAKRLIVLELQSPVAASDTTGRATFRVCEKLRRPLSSLIGMAGFRSLFSRALTLAKGEVPWLGGLEVGADGVMEFSTAMKAQLDGEEAVRGGTALVAQLLGLLVTFIGEALTLRLVHNVWPTAAVPDSEPKVNSHEKNS